VSTRELDQLGETWKEYEALARRSRLGWGTSRLERSLVQRTSALANRVINNYRMALPTVREAQWQSARDALARALTIAPDDTQLRAAFHYCEGHLHRINGEAEKGRQDDPNAQRELTEAVASFREAAELRPNWPDPFLGLARVFIFGLENVERGADALDQAQSRGYALTERETSLLADGYRALGNTLVRNAGRLSGMPQESEYLTRAAEAYQRALNLYTQSTTTPNITESIRGTQRAHDQTQFRLAEIAPPEPPPPPSTEPPSPAESSTPSSDSEPRGSAQSDLEPWV
jgi:tetratricopeptide (TPR) repeat protein